MRVLIVDDNQDSLKSLELVLTDLGHEPVALTSAEDALKAVDAEYFPLIVSDIRMPGMDGLELLSRLRSQQNSITSDVVLITGHGDRDTAIEALRKGAYDYLSKPLSAQELAAVVERCTEHQALLLENQSWRTQFHSRLEEATQSLRQHLTLAQERLRDTTGISEVVAESPAMVKLLRECLIYHEDPEVPVLLEGETGTGKEVLARLIHYGNKGNSAPFVAINCSAIPTELFESELFGHDPGAYTGSSRQGAKGKLELAGKGTVFLDEIAEMPQSLQPKLLRVLEERSYYRLGGSKELPFRARVICAANRRLGELVDAGKFRRDLYHRLKVGHMVIPPLRERPQDIDLLAMHFLQRQAARKKKRFREIHSTTREILLSYGWPGNVRELENAIERAVLTSDGETLLPGHIYFLFSEDQNRRKVIFEGSEHFAEGAVCLNDPDKFILPDDGLNLEELNQTLINKALDKFGGNKSRAAKYLGLSRYALHRRVQK
ncbi:sigma-54-dependent Fis family transcriptional regulator [Oceanidesulfovibrio indonesiensis]|uniref:Sigma-54-dependent Fis family transcriptional regulator n=1 Tax=Oceanidesulfovibrio indonesiensis TaxID=54767 RepID=A0A7M3MF00_9BACT|nr:sigma-54 dependent transcriptional regulator [Oceanidesulfovibrio indonesiensis]TVM17132.1 sigma-54-dependent Fis family transcriptional regulator [Oceanidesulfovibrio indonesiensis]